MRSEFLWYIPNEVRTGHRGDDVHQGHNSLRTLVDQARAIEEHGWGGALIGTGYWRPGQLRLRRRDAGPSHRRAGARQNRVGPGRPGGVRRQRSRQADRYARTGEFIQIVRKLWTEEDATYHGEHFSVTRATMLPRPTVHDGRGHPRIYFGGASAAAEQVAATEADVQLFWGEPLDGVRERIERLNQLGGKLGREYAPLEYGLRVTTVVRETTEEVWAAAEAKVAAMAKGSGSRPAGPELAARRRPAAVGRPGRAGRGARRQPLHGAGQVRRHRCGRHLAGRIAKDVAQSLRKYQDLGVSHLVLWDTPYLAEVKRQGDQLLPLLRG